jgi:hypothetical protein
MSNSGGKLADVGPLSEATLMRFVDGDLPPREHAFVAELVAAHRHASGSVRAYCFTKEELPGAYDVAMNVSSELIGRCLPAPGRRRWRLPGWRLSTFAVAASLAAFPAGAAGWLLRAATHPDVASLPEVAAPALQSALETTPAGGIAPVSDTLLVRPFSTFISRRWCRQYTLGDGQRERARGIACRGEDGWRILVQATSDRAPSGGHVPAGSEDGRVAAYRDQILGISAVLDTKDEEHLIRNEHWQRAP